MDQLYGFFYNPCFHESAAALISLHRTKKGAYNAMRQHLLEDFESWQRMSRQYRVGFKPHYAQRRFICVVDVLE